jgi:HK97 gp10 family phage protein
MASLKFTMPDEFIKKLQELEKNAVDIIEDILKAGGKVGLSAVQANLGAVVGKVPNSRSTGELKSSLGVTSVKKDRKGVYNLRIGFNEPRRKQSEGKRKQSTRKVTNGMVANVLEYGKSGQRPRPFLISARLKSENEVKAAMQEELDKAVK